MTNTLGYQTWEVIQLQLLFEQLVLFPIPQSKHSNKQQKTCINAVVHERLLRFKQGRIRELYHESRSIQSKSPKEQADHPVDILRSAQIAADSDNFKSANARVTKHAPVALINDDNFPVLEKLHPPSLDRGCLKPSISTRTGGTRRKIRLTPKSVLHTLSHLNRGKATGIQCDSLDIYVIASRRLDLSNPTDARRANALASFFNKIINGDVPPQFQTFLRQTYLVALEKDELDKSKLRPLGVPSATRRISAILVVSEYSSTFAEYVLPFNYAIGVNGGIDVIIKTIQLAVDKYIIEPENANSLPTRSLVSLDITNMFNSISREKLREVIAHKFPSLESFADLIYDGAGETFVKLENGQWTSIPVQEGFSQGCPASPIFAAIVLNEIISQLYPELEARAASRLANGISGDDGLGSLAILLAYVDDVNCVIHHDDIEFFLRRFTELASPLGAVLNTDKTRILTTTTNSSLVQTLLNHDDLSLVIKGKQLEQTIAKYSTSKLDDGSRIAVEVTDGLRILGVPIGSTSFCSNFILKALQKADSDASKLLSKLDDLQTILRLFSTCTANKVTHLFGCDVYNSNPDELPNAFFLWDSPLTTKFDTMTANLLENITNSQALPIYSQIISNMSINQGGLGIQNPRANAIIQYMSTTKRCLQYVHEGIWLGINKPRPLLPPSITLLYSDWESSQNRSWQIFRKYLPSFNNIATNGKADSPNDYIYKASLNGSREKAKDFASQQIRTTVLENEIVTPDHVREILPALLDKRVSMALMTMSRIDQTNRIPNTTFFTALKRKLRMKIHPDISSLKCKCGSALDEYGDHCLGCKANSKTKASNGIRDEITKIFERILPIAKMIDSPRQLEKEIYNVVPSLPRLKPFDLSIRLDTSLDSGTWRVPFSRIGFDVTLIHSTKPSSSTTSEAATYYETDLRLRDGEKMKFARRRGGTNEITNRTLSPDEVIGEILNTNNVFIPIAVGPFGDIGSIFRRFIENHRTLPLPSFPSDRPNALKAAERAINVRTPYDVFGKADRAWKREHGNALLDRSYLSNCPSQWANQKLGLAVTTHLANHINSSLSKVKYDGTALSQSQNVDDNLLIEDNNGWNFYDDPLVLHERDDDSALRVLTQDSELDHVFHSRTR